MTDISPQTSTDSAVQTQSIWSSDLAILMYLALATVIVHLITGRQYGFHRDELVTLDDARNLDWGFVAYPPITPFFGHLSLLLFGTSLTGFRFFAAVVDAIALVLTGLMAREMGGGRGAQLVAAAATLPFCLGAGALMQYVSFDYMFWVLTAYFVVRLLKSDDPRWWLAIGAAIGLGMMAKYTMAFFVLSIVVAILATDTRRYLRNKWLWYGVGLSLLIFLPNLLWQFRHNFISLDFLNHIHARDVRWGRARNFFPGQLELMLLTLPIAVAGLYFYFLSGKGNRFRMLGWIYAVTLLLFAVAQGRWYYMAAGYPILYAGGGVWGEQWLATMHRGWAGLLRALVLLALTIDAGVAGSMALPLAPINSPWWKVAIKVNGDFREELGWPELVETVAQIRDKLPPEDRARLGVLAGNYGEAGAINLFGPNYGLPPAISGVNSFWQRGYGNPPPQTLVVVGLSHNFVEENFSSCELAGHAWNRYGVLNEETVEHPDIYVCRGLKRPWPDFWKDFRYFG